MANAYSKSRPKRLKQYPEVELTLGSKPDLPQSRLSSVQLCFPTGHHHARLQRTGESSPMVQLPKKRMRLRLRTTQRWPLCAALLPGDGSA